MSWFGSGPEPLRRSPPTAVYHPPMATGDESLMRNLGRFVGAIWHGVKSDPRQGRTEVKRSVEQYPAEHDGKRVIVRRTTIEEVEVPKDERRD